MPPPGYEPFLHAICANPEDDLARLVYADWLDENGGESDRARAEFIRLQIRRAQLKAGGANSPDLKDRDIKLRAAHEEQWRRELPLEFHPDTWQRFWRGFVSGATVKAREFLQNSDVIFTAAPIQFLHVKGLSDGSAGRFGACDRLKQLHGLTISESGLCAGWMRLLAPRTLVNLRWLELRANVALPADAARVLATLPKLTHMNIKGAVGRTVAGVLADGFGPNAKWQSTW